MKTAVSFLIFLFTLSWVVENLFPIVVDVFEIVECKTQDNKTEEKENEKKLEKLLVDSFNFYSIISETKLTLHLYNNFYLNYRKEVNSPPPDKLV